MVSKSLVHFCFLSSKEVLLTYIFSKYSNSDLKMGGIRCFGIAILVLIGFLGSTQAQLQLGFYSKNCPKCSIIGSCPHKDALPWLLCQGLCQLFYLLTWTFFHTAFLSSFFMSVFLYMNVKILPLLVVVTNREVLVFASYSGVWCVFASELNLK